VKDSGNPFAEPPRLGISHLLVWTTCVAFYLGIMRSFWLLSPEQLETPIFFRIIDGLYGMGSGTALVGLVLFAARRYRRIRFPVYPGEVLLVALGASTVLGLMKTMLIWFALPESDLLSLQWLRLIDLVSGLGNALIYFIAAVRVKVTRWRTYLATVVVVSALHGCALFRLPWAIIPYIVTSPLPSLVLAVVVLMDVIQRKKYPWTHWVGVGIAVWLAILNVGMLLFRLLGGMALLA
jgi:hypothetical protein